MTNNKCTLNYSWTSQYSKEIQQALFSSKKKEERRGLMVMDYNPKAPSHFLLLFVAAASKEVSEKQQLEKLVRPVFPKQIKKLDPWIKGRKVLVLQ